MKFIDNRAMKCPVFKETVESQYIKEWHFQEYSVKRYGYENCGNKFNFYEGNNGKKYTIPKQSM